MYDARLDVRTTSRQRAALTGLAQRVRIPESALLRYAIQGLLDAAPATQKQEDALLDSVAETEYEIIKLARRSSGSVGQHAA